MDPGSKISRPVSFGGNSNPAIRLQNHFVRNYVLMLKSGLKILQVYINKYIG